MTDEASSWESRVALTWKDSDSMPPGDLVLALDQLAAERPAGDAAALFERASARDTVGRQSEAQEFYRAALATGGLDATRHARAIIQLASTLRILGQLQESERLLTARVADAGDHGELVDEARAFLALTYAAQGRAVEAAGLALMTLAPHLSRYHRSVSGNAAELIENAAPAT